jgi:hypothetical protein
MTTFKAPQFGSLNHRRAAQLNAPLHPPQVRFQRQADLIRQAKPIGSVENDPSRRFATVNYRAAKGSFDHLVGAYKKRLLDGEAKRARFYSRSHPSKCRTYKQRPSGVAAVLPSALTLAVSTPVD